MPTHYGPCIALSRSNGLKADAIIHPPTDEWAAIAVKLRLYHKDEGAKNLLALKEKIDTDHMHSPSFLWCSRHQNTHTAEMTGSMSYRLDV